MQSNGRSCGLWDYKHKPSNKEREKTSMRKRFLLYSQLFLRWDKHQLSELERVKQKTEQPRKGITRKLNGTIHISYTVPD